MAYSSPVTVYNLNVGGRNYELGQTADGFFRWKNMVSPAFGEVSSALAFFKESYEENSPEYEYIQDKELEAWTRELEDLSCDLPALKVH